jgi:hypothetical protein
MKYNDDSIVRVAKLNFVDLAGFENQKNTESLGIRFEEAKYINTSLSNLGVVIRKLVEGKNKNSHVPYRNSILTKLLKDSLGGNSRTMFIGTVSSKSEWISETE